MTGIVSTPAFLTDDGIPLFTVLTLPSDGSVRGAALICPPLGKEHNHTARGFKRLAEKLAAERIATLRFNYAGTGESSGSQTDPDAVDHWDTSITRCMNYLNDLGFPSPAVVAHRSGALLATNNSRVRTTSRALALWDPVDRGRVFVRTQQMLYAAISEGPEDVAVEPEHLTQLAGLSLHKQAARTLSRLTIDPESVVEVHNSNILALVRDDDLDGSLATAVENAGGTVKPIGDQAPFIDAIDPWFTDYPAEMPGVARWLSARFGTGTTTISPVATTSAVVGNTTDGRPVQTRLCTTDDGVIIWDTAILGNHESADRVLVSHSIGHDIGSGPTRFYTEMAFDVAARGGRMVRFDRRGVGESGQTAPEDTFTGLFTTPYVRDGLQILDEVDLSHAKVVAHVGVCAGSWMSAHAAIETASRLPGARSVAVVVNPNRWDLRPARPVPHLSRSTPAWHTPAWHAKVEHQRQRVIARCARDLIEVSARVRPRLARTALSRVRGFQMPDVFIDTIRRRGATVRLVFGPGDHDRFTRLDGYRSLARRRINVAVASSQTGDHSGYHTGIRDAMRRSCLEALGLTDASVVEADQPVHSPVR
ncbi:alpha/beta hydrolase [Gordonia sp. 852002-51296_SCH5728562-b]|uniref:alpha/beta hydrolase n=1 Tax=Gordonia sp. 852002-51296_SCH5728562-b TaxID=1834101 RepID=UPI0007EA749E|nr:alpha/beta hydrolase [Gordonia sp. 852002-51296_SCH5728562-b]OBA30837.1 hypothetical protein A5766_14920 [Gordonia sp. 852002-51296_SCH5728562-b]